MTTNTSEWWRFTASALVGGCGLLAGIVVTLVMFWFGGDFVTNADLTRRMQSQEAFVTESIALNREQINESRGDLRKLTEQVGELIKSQAELTGELRQLTRQLQTRE